MKVPMLKASFVGSKKDLKKVIDALKSTSSFQMTRYKKTEKFDEQTVNTEYDNLIAIQKRLENACAIANLKDNKSGVEYQDLKVFKQYEKDANAIAANLEQIQKEIARIDSIINNNNEKTRDLNPYMDLPVSFDNLQGTRSVAILCGIMPNVQYQRFVNDFSSAKINIESFPSGKTNKCVVITTLREDEAITDAIYSYDFIPSKFSFDKDAAEMSKFLTSENSDMAASRAQLIKKTQLTAEEANILKRYYDYISNEADTIKLMMDALQTKDYFVLNGWITEDSKEIIQNKISEIAPNTAVTFKKPTHIDDTPVMLKNTKLVTPFRSITNMYGQPGGRDIDPNPFVAIFFFIFFGMMIGDIGYAVILSFSVAAFIYFKKPQQSTKQFLLLFGICGVSSLVWGFLYGNIFGFTISTRIFNPLDNAIYILLLALMMGLIQMAVGLIINLWIYIRNKQILQAIIKGIPRVVLFVGLILFLPKLGFQIFDLKPVAFFNTINRPGMYITLAGAVTTALTNPYSLVSYFNDTVSYVRLFALALVGAVIGSIGNKIGGMLFGIPFVGYPLGVIVAVIFHIFNLGLGLLSAYIHGARLHFIEFFSKFYTGSGSEFRPIGSNLRYTYIKGER